MSFLCVARGGGWFNRRIRIRRLTKETENAQHCFVITGGEAADDEEQQRLQDNSGGKTAEKEAPAAPTDKVQLILKTFLG